MFVLPQQIFEQPFFYMKSIMKTLYNVGGEEAYPCMYFLMKRVFLNEKYCAQFQTIQEEMFFSRPEFLILTFGRGNNIIA